MHKNIEQISAKECTGCSSCSNVCPTEAISMDYDREGFRSPVVNQEECIECGKCVEHCPIASPIFDKNTEPSCYAAMAKDDAIREASSSGGIFTLLAQAIFDKGGVVCGAAFRTDFTVEHVIIDSAEELDKLRGSKYLQSDTGTVFKEIKSLLKKGIPVLYCSTPCQVAGLNSFLKKDYDTLLTIDLMCHGGPSPLLFKQYLRETFPDREIERYSFRDKSVFGWSTEANIYFKDGGSEHIVRNQDLFYRAFLPCLSVRRSCAICKFATLPRQGDLTLADFWGASKYNKDFDDGKGTSIVIVNSCKGEAFHKKIGPELKLDTAFPLEYVKSHGQPLTKPFLNNPARNRFFEIVENATFDKAVTYVRNYKYDVGIIGVWPGLNYGSVLTYYALQKAIKGMGLSPLMIDKPGAAMADPEAQNSHSRRFAKKHFYISKIYPLKDLKILNNNCDSFIIGSDQVWNYGISKNFGGSFYLDFVRPDRKKIAYASSFGHVVDFAPKQKVAEISYLMKQFDAISVREDDGVRICKEVYGVEAVQVVDPVFLLEPKEYRNLADVSQLELPRKYVLAYFLDATEEKKLLLQTIANDLGLEIVILLDGFSHNAEKNRQLLNMDDKIVKNPEVEDWLKCFCGASYVVTDSFHGCSFSVIFKKQFSGLMNKGRGFSRFQSLARLLDLDSHMYAKPLDALNETKYRDEINYENVEAKLSARRDFSYAWLKEALFSTKFINNMSSYPIKDVRSIRCGK